MDRQVIAKAVELFIDPSIRRTFGTTKDYWLELRLCLDKKPNQRKRVRIVGQIDTVTGLKDSITDFAMSSQADWLLAMAYKVSHDAKKEDQSHAQKAVAYAYKHFLLNILILLFAERHEIFNNDETIFTGRPNLFLKRDSVNQLNLNLRFLVGYTLSRDAGSQIYQQPTAPQHAIGFHLPSNQLIREVAEIIKPSLLRV